MAAVRGTIHDSPWSGISPDPLLGQEGDPRRKRRPGGGNGDENGNDNDDMDELEALRRQGTILEEGCILQTLDLVIQMLLTLDACVGVFGVVFGLVLHQKHPESLYAILWLLVLGFLALKRALAVTMGLFIPTESLWSCRRVGLTVAGYVSLLLAILEGLSAILGLVFAKNVQHYMQNEKLDLTTHQVDFLVQHYSIIIIVLTVLAILEGVKWQVYLMYRRSILYLEEEEERMTEAQLIRREAARGRPWWWTSTVSRHGQQRHRHNRNVSVDSALTDTLLDDAERAEHGGGGRSRKRQRFFLLWPFGKTHGGGGGDARDDGSVDFASVQEEWASRAEEDPVWWSREDNEDDVVGRSISNNNYTGTPREVDTSWAHDTSEL